MYYILHSSLSKNTLIVLYQNHLCAQMKNFKGIISRKFLKKSFSCSKATFSSVFGVKTAV